MILWWPMFRWHVDIIFLRHKLKFLQLITYTYFTYSKLLEKQSAKKEHNMTWRSYKPIYAKKKKMNSVCWIWLDDCSLNLWFDWIRILKCKMAVQLVQYMDLRQAIDINPPSYHIIQIQVRQLTNHCSSFFKWWVNKPMRTWPLIYANQSGLRVEEMKVCMDIQISY